MRLAGWLARHFLPSENPSLGLCVVNSSQRVGVSKHEYGRPIHLSPSIIPWKLDLLLSLLVGGCCVPVCCCGNALLRI